MAHCATRVFHTCCPPRFVTVVLFKPLLFCFPCCWSCHWLLFIVAADCASSPTAGRQPSQAHKAHLMTASRTLSLFCSQQTTRARPLQSSSSHRAFTQTWMCTATSVLTSYRTSGLRSMMYVQPLCLFAPSSENPTTTALSTRLLRLSGARYESMRLTFRM